MKKTDYNFGVEFQAIQTADSLALIPNRQAVVRQDTGMAIGIVSKKYALVPHKEVVSTFREAFGENAVEETIKMTHNGARMHLEFLLPDITVKVDKGDEVAMRLVVENSYDGSKRLQIIFGAFRLVCSNGMIIGRKFLALNRRHIGVVGLEVDSIRGQVMMLTEMFKKQEPVMRAMNETKLTVSPIQFFDPKNLKIPAYLAKLAQEAYGHDGKTVWDAYNATTAVLTRGMKKESPEQSIKFGKNAWSAATALLK